ncbi:hypothetical protein HAZT_HAZT002974 [Hyalella azteca]|uniref:Uncharacterized protein n=1 Tax=Hyalella azteca TaxID=294128 RepID=A0A6A0GVH3_HYAAZ|nr:hypothetical protein HAZT_HAZT002974 [Hyalella azteca]
MHFVCRFYFPQGRPTTPAQQEASVQRVVACFRDHGGQITRDQLAVLMRACDLPLYWKAPVFVAAGGEKLGYLTQELFTDYWTRVLSTCHDEASRFIHVLSRGARNYILPEDLVGLIQDVVDSHPGLAFLKDAAEFHSRYVHTVGLSSLPIRAHGGCMDIDGDGFLSMYELEYFYEEQLQRMEALGIETLPFHDCLCQMLDMVRPEFPDKISLTDLKRCRMTPIFFDTFFNLEKYLDHEQRDPFASHRAEDDGPETSDWDRFAAEEYELLVAEEGGADPQDDIVLVVSRGYGAEDELSAGLEAVLARGGGGVDGINDVCPDSLSTTTSIDAGRSVGLNKHSSLSATLTNLAVDAMDVDDDYADYVDSDDYHY